MNGNKYFPQPSSTWGMDDWLRAADEDIGGPRLMEIASTEAARLGIGDEGDPMREVQSKQYYDWNRNKGIPYRPNALALIAALGLLAGRNEVNLLNGALLREHARIFLTSKACEHKFAELTEEELVKLSRVKTATVENNFAEQERHVHPPPPHDLFGRAIDLDRVLEGMRSSRICVIDSVAGNGKTSLAWFATKLAVQRGLVFQFSWTTDKRIMINPKTGEERPTPEYPLDFNRIMRSMATRFNWLDVASSQDHELEELCAQRLQKGLYLLIIDNLETMSQYTEVIDRLNALLRPRKDMSPQMSRALVTSREQVAFPGCYRVEIQGLDEQASYQLIRALEPGLLGQRVDPLTNDQASALWEATHGNPLFLSIALARYSKAPRHFDDIIDHLRGGTNFSRAFENLFGTLYASLSDDARWLATVAVGYPVILFKNLLQAFIDASGNRESFDLALGQLIELRILDALSTGEAEYVFHPLIKAYILKRTRGEA